MLEKSQYIKITKPDKSIHFSPVSNLSKLTHQNNLRKQEDRYKLENVSLTENELKAQPVRDASYSSPKANNELALAQKLISSKEKEIENLKAQLAAKNNVTAPAADVNETKAKPGNNAADVVAAIEKAETIEDVDALTIDDTRVTVMKAAEKRKTELSL